MNAINYSTVRRPINKAAYIQFSNNVIKGGESWNG